MQREMVAEAEAEAEARPAPPAPTSSAWQPIPSREMGYVQSVDLSALLQLALRHGTTLRMECGIGDFVSADLPLMSAALSGALDEALIAGVNRAYATATYRTIEQDPAFGLRQLEDIALKALSAGTNDSTTAATCIAHLAVLLSRCATRCLTPPSRFAQGEWRVLAKGPDFADLASLAFLQILENAEGNTEILCCLLDALARIAHFTRYPERIRVLQHWQGAVADQAQRSVSSEHALKKVENCLRRTAASLERAAQAAGKLAETTQAPLCQESQDQR